MTRLVIVLMLGAQAATAVVGKTPRTVDGKPDLQGVWNYSSDVPLERPKEYADRTLVTRDERAKQNAAREASFDRLLTTGVGAHDKFWLDYEAQVEDLRTSLITYPENGRLPKLVDGVQRVGGFAAIFNDVKGTLPVRFFAGGIGKDGPEDRGLFERCLAGPNTGPPLTPGGDNNYLEIAQTRDYVLVLTEHIHDARIIPLDQKPHVGQSVRMWNGDARGRWEGTTLVVETTNFNGKGMLATSAASGRLRGVAQGANSHVVERFTPLDKDTIKYEVTITDREAFSQPVTIMMPLNRDENYLIVEYGCHEGNYAIPNELTAGRKADRDAVGAKTSTP